MERKLDTYLDQLQEGPILIGMGVLAAAMIAGGYIGAKIDAKKAERILTAHKPIVDRIVAAHLNKIIGKATQLGSMLKGALLGKYKHVTKYWSTFSQDSLKTLNNRAIHEKAVKAVIRNTLMALVNRNGRLDDKTPIFYFTGELDLRPADDDSHENALTAKDDPMKTRQYPDSENNVVYQKWSKEYQQAIQLLVKADKAIHPLFKKVINEILSSIAKAMQAGIKKEGLVHEAGFETKPKGWDQKSIKKYSGTFTKNMKGNVKSPKFFEKCVKKMTGKVENPEGFCASLKDEAYGSTYWRGKDKSPKEVKKDTAKHKNV